jgi:hypothetical protein
MAWHAESHAAAKSYNSACCPNLPADSRGLWRWTQSRETGLPRNDFPANREKNREFFKSKALRWKLTLNRPSNSMRCG